MYRRTPVLLLLMACLVPAGGVSGQTPTRLLVRAVAHDAKIIGSGVGGARITIRDTRSGAVLAEGIQEGSTGDTQAIMREPRPRAATAYDARGAAHFLATLDLDGPTRVEVSAEGPLDFPAAVQRVSTTILMVPGEDVVGEGLVLVLHGFLVDVVSAQTSGRAGRDVEVRATVRMMCGCPTEPGGLWDSDAISVRARLLADGEPVAETTLSYAGEPSTFTGRLAAMAPGSYELAVLAVETDKANAGMATVPLTIGP